MALVVIKYSEDNLQALKELGFTHLGNQETTHGSYIELYTMGRKYRHYYGVYPERITVTVDELYSVLLLPTNDAVYAYLNSRNSDG